MKRIEKIYNLQTNEETFVEYEESAQDKAAREELEKALAIEAEKREAKLLARKQILEKLGLTEEEAAALLG